jgi:osmotically-inducible protein OsmY
MATDNHYLIGKIQNAIASDPRVNKQDVKVAIRGRRVHLMGQTSTAERRLAITAIVAEIVPDLEVCNELAIIEVTGPIEPEIIHD